MRNRTGLLVAPLLFLLLPLSGCSRSGDPAASARPAPRNVVLISIDTLRRDRLGAYGYERPVSPAIDELARDAVVFDQAIAQAPWTAPSHAAMLTSYYPSVLRMGKFSDPGKISPVAETLAEVLQANGLHTLGVTEAGFVSAEFGFDQGFDTYQSRPNSVRGVRLATELLDRLDPGERFYLFFHTYDVHDYEPPAEYAARFVRPYDGYLLDTDEMVRATLHAHPRFREKVRHFGQHEWRIVKGLHDHTLDVADAGAEYREIGDFLGDLDLTVKKLLQNHQACAPVVATFGEAEWRYVRDLYDANVACVDDSLRLLFDHLRRRGLLDDTLIVFTSDHGEEFGEHGGSGHGYTLYEENLRVPLILRHPSLDPGRIDAQVRLIDLPPTICDLLGFAAPAQWQGVSLRAIMNGSPELLPALSENAHRPYKSLRTPSNKYIVEFHTPFQHLYNLEQDPTEVDNLALAGAPPIKDKMRLRLLSQVRENSALMISAGTDAAAMSQETIDQLKSLGYLGGSGGEPHMRFDDWIRLLQADLKPR